MATMRSKVGQLEIQKQEGMKKRWKSHMFKVSGSTYLLYFKSADMSRPDGQLLLGNITKVEANSGAKGADFPFEVHFKGKPMQGHSGSPWVLNASSNEERLQWMDAIKPGSSANLRAISNRNTLRVAEREHYQQEYQRIQPSPPPSYPPPQLSDADLSPQSPKYAPQQAPPTFTMPPNVKPPKNFDANASWHGRPNVYRNPEARRNNSLPSPDEIPQPYLEPEFLPSVQEHSSMNGQGGGNITLAPAPAAFDSRSMPRNLERQGNQFAQTNGGDPRHQQRPQPHQRRHGASFTKSSTSQDVTATPPPRLPLRSNTDTEIQSPMLVLDENDDPYQMMLSSPARVANKEAVDSSHSMKPKPKPRSRKSHSPNSSPSIKPANPPVQKQTMVSNEYVELCDDSGARVEGDDNGSSPTDATANVPAVDVMSSLNQLVAGGMRQSECGESASGGGGGGGAGGGVVPGDLAQSFTSSQLHLLINMLQKVQAEGGSNGEPSNGEGEREGGGGRGDRVQTPLSPQRPIYEVEDAQDHMALKGNFKRALSYAPNLPEEQILITDDDGSYLPRPEWAKATGASTIQIYGDTSDLHIDSTLSDLEEEALYISRDALEDFVPIGEGQFGQVYRAMLKHGVAPIQVAVKTAKKSSSSKEKAEFMREMTIMSQMMHPNIVRLYGVVQEDMQSPWIVLEYLKNGDLKKFLMKNKRPVKQLVKYMIDISMGMHYLAEKGLVHRDLAARNILVGDNETCKVADFGLLREIPKDDSIYQMHTNVPCPVRWMPPESISQRKFSTASDVWSFGVLQWEMFNPKKLPYGNSSNMDVAMKVATGYRLPVPRNIPPVVARIMKACWHKSPEKRPSFLLISTLLTTKVTFDEE